MLHYNKFQVLQKIQIYEIFENNALDPKVNSIYSEIT